MRGKVGYAGKNHVESGITPAYAGKRFAKQYRRSIDWDHPRLCGEKKQRTGRCAGSIRITPAYAGKSIFDCVISTCKMGSPPPMRGKVQLAVQPRTTFWDHPRLCGEKISHALFIMLAMGSPPPMRGKVNCFVVIVQPRRITPAYAGKRWFRSPSSFALGDHPRLCGEK